MALDAANFIAELSITDPPGTDPLSQGDDQIRTIKRATQQSFPNIDKAVTKTADQMNLMAILNENQVFTGTSVAFQDTALRVNQTLSANDGSLLFIGISATQRWNIGRDADDDGGDFRVQRFDAAGLFLDEPFQIDAVTGQANFTVPPTVDGAPLWIAGEIRQFILQATPGTNWFKADGTNGTQNLANRYLVGSGLSSAGNILAPNLDAATNDTPATGSTAITVSQMPSHAHDSRAITGNGGIGDVSVGFPSNETVMGGQRGVTGGTYIRNNSQGNEIVRSEGGGAGHTHTVPVIGVDAAGTDRNAVRPLSFVMDYFQYVP